MHKTGITPGQNIIHEPGILSFNGLFLRRTLVRLVLYAARRRHTIGQLLFQTRQRTRLAAIAGLLIIVLSSKAQNNIPVLKVTGEVTKPLELSAADVAKMKRSTVTMKDRDGKDHAYTGTPVQDILELAGVTTGKQLRGENLTKYLLVKCADGYQVLFSLAELDSSFTDRVVILADETEGKPLPVAKGPFRLVIPGEKKPARSSFQVTEFVVKFAKD